MSTFTHSESLSRQTVEEWEQTARKSARIVVGLLTGLVILSVTTYQGYSGTAELCRKVNAVDTFKLRSIGEPAITAIKAVQEQCK